MFSRWSTVVAVALATVLAAPLVAGCSSGGKASHGPASTGPTPIAKLDPGRVRIVRGQFCNQVAAAEVRRALGAQPDANQHWGNGEPVPSDGPASGAATSGDVGHELGCAWTTTTGAAARAWVFARPVAAPFAQTIVAQAGREPGCTSAAASLFGSPALLQTCTRPGGVERVRRAGLFGDTWLTCELAGPASSRPRARLDAWCAAVVAALRVS